MFIITKYIYICRLLTKKQKMKKILLFTAIAGLVVASCKKDRTCTCIITPVSETVNGVPGIVGLPSTRVDKFTKVSKKGAACNSWSDEANTTLSTVSGTLETTITITKGDCKLS